jgi:hypothetical protein
VKRRQPPPAPALPSWLANPQARHWLEEAELRHELAPMLAYRRMRAAMVEATGSERACPPRRPAMPGHDDPAVAPPPAYLVDLAKASDPYRAMRRLA